MSSTSPTSPDQYASPSRSPAWRARRAFSPSEAWKIEIDLDSDRVRSKNSGLGRQQQLVHVGGFPAAIRVPAELGAIRRLALAEQQVVRLALNPLARLEPE